MLRAALLSISTLALLLCAAAEQKCECNPGTRLATADSPAYSATAASLGSPFLDVSSLAMTLLADSMGSPHKLAMVLTAMYEAHASSPSTAAAQLTSAKVSPGCSIASAGLEALARVLMSEPSKQTLLAARMVHLNLTRGNNDTRTIVSAVLMKYPLSKPKTVKFAPVNNASKSFDADCNMLAASDKWQAQCVQMKRGAPCMPQKVPFLSFFNASLISAGGARSVGQFLSALPAPPKFAGPLSELPFNWENAFAKEYRATLHTSGHLNDKQKFIAEFFAPNAALQVANIALHEAVVRNLSEADAVKLLFGASAAARDAVAVAVTTKLSTQSVRPITVLQCAFEGEEVWAWNEPYYGVRKFVNRRDRLWRPYLQTPPFPGYISGHSAVMAAGLTVMKNLLGDDSVRGPNCAVRKEGMSVTEPRILKGAAGYIEGVTDVPNSGPWSKGYSPAKDVSICWKTFSTYSTMLARSREYGGIHIPTDNWTGVKLGNKLGGFVLRYVRSIFDGKVQAS